MPSADEIARYEELIAENLPFYEALRKKMRRPKTPAQRQFQDVAWGKERPVTEHEKAYVHYLASLGILGGRRPAPPGDDSGIEAYPAGLRPISPDAGRKWDEEWIDPPDRG